MDWKEWKCEVEGEIRLIGGVSCSCFWFKFWYEGDKMLIVEFLGIDLRFWVV